MMRRSAQAILSRHPQLYERLLRALGRGSLEKRTMLRVLRAGDVVVDVGANDGYFTLLFSDVVGASGTVHAFEPVQPTYDRLCNRLRQTAFFDNVTVTCAACSDTEGAGAMFVPDTDFGQAALTVHRAGSWAAAAQVVSYETRFVTLDSCFRESIERRPITFVKIDVEGSELHVLRGLTRIAAIEHPLLLVEVYGAWTQSFGHRPADVLDHLRQTGYDRIFVLTDAVHEVTYQDAARLADAEPLNLLCGCRRFHMDRVEQFG